MGFKRKILKKLWRSKIFPFQILVRVLPANLLRFLWFMFVIVFIIVPSSLGTYSFLRFHDVPWYIAVFSTLGIELGGPLVNIIHHVMALPKASGMEQVFIAVGILTSFIHFHTLYRIYRGFMEAFQTTINSVLMWIIGVSLLSLFIGITLLTDKYILTDSVLRLSGITYVLESPRAVMDPLINVLESHTKIEDTFTLKTAANNTITGGSR